MNRNMKKAVEDYRKKHYNQKTVSRAGSFYYSDMQQMKQLAEEAAAATDPAHYQQEVLINAIMLSLEAGYQIGYRTAVRNAKKRNR